MKDDLAKQVGEPLYFPFELGEKRALRPMQGYLFKLPSAFVKLFDREPPSDGVRLPTAAYSLGNRIAPLTNSPRLQNATHSPLIPP